MRDAASKGTQTRSHSRHYREARKARAGVTRPRPTSKPILLFFCVCGAARVDAYSMAMVAASESGPTTVTHSTRIPVHCFINVEAELAALDLLPAA